MSPFHSEAHSPVNQELTGHDLIGRLRAMPMMLRMAVRAETFNAN